MDFIDGNAWPWAWIVPYRNQKDLAIGFLDRRRCARKGEDDQSSHPCVYFGLYFCFSPPPPHPCHLAQTAPAPWARKKCLIFRQTRSPQTFIPRCSLFPSLHLVKWSGCELGFNPSNALMTYAVRPGGGGLLHTGTRGIPR